MMQRLLSFLKELPGGSPQSGYAPDDPRVAAAALMYHVINADGVRQDVEWERLKQLFSQAYGATGNDLSGLLAAGERAHEEAIDLYAFTSVLNRNLEPDAKVHFIELLWRLAYADGHRHELEDHVVWRIADLMGVSSRERVLARQRALESAGISDAEGAGDGV